MKRTLLVVTSKEKWSFETRGRQEDIGGSEASLMEDLLEAASAVGLSF